jgi:hypothetical protein
LKDFSKFKKEHLIIFPFHFMVMVRGLVSCGRLIALQTAQTHWGRTAIAEQEDEDDGYS